jgi:hypothetical protein
LLNGPAIEGKLRSGVVQKMMAGNKPPEQVIDTIYVRCLSRKPSAEEMAKLTAVVKAAPNPQAGLEDVFWAVMNSREFMFNH